MLEFPYRMESDTLTKSIRGSVLHIGVSIVTIIFGFVRTILLMRWLADPDPFGAITLALFFSNLTIPFATFGVDAALLQAKDPPASAFSTNFILRVTLSSSILLICFLSTPILELFYSEQVVFLIFLMFGLNVIEATYGTHTIVLRRDLRFGSLAIINLIASLAMSIVAPLLAFLGYGIWSLVAERVVSAAVRWISMWVFLRPWKVVLQFDIEQAKSQLTFGSHVVLTNVMGILLDRFDDFWTGTTLGQTALGIYSRAYEIAQYPERILATPLTNVFFSTYAALQDRANELKESFWIASAFLVRAGFLLTVLLFSTARELTLILFGDAWLPIVPVFRLMLIYVIIDPIYVNLSYLMIGLGLPQLLNRARFVQLFVFVISIMIFSRFWNIYGVAWAANIMMLAGTALLFWFTRHLVPISLVKLLRFPTLAAITSGIFAGLISQFMPSEIQGWLKLIVTSLLIAFVYLILLLLTERDLLQDMLHTIYNKTKGILSNNGQ